MDKDRKTEELEKKRKEENKKNKEKDHDDELLDEGLEETFPASDPPSHSRPQKNKK